LASRLEKNSDIGKQQIANHISIRLLFVGWHPMPRPQHYALKPKTFFDSFAELTNTVLVNVRHPPYTK